MWGVEFVVLFGMWAVLRLTWDKPKDEFEGYTKAIADIERVAENLTTIVTFLKQERVRVLKSEETVSRLRDEQTQLEPVILTQRETVNAILAAHAKTTASSTWKERSLGFISGLLTSLIATIVWEFFRR
jgi:hypothetical protein